jgi:hypothetical protein
MGANTDSATVVRNMIITGLGFGFVLPVYTLAVQNAMPYSRLGVVTSSVQFARSIGSTIGITILGTIVADVYAKSFAQVQSPQLKQVLDAAAARGHAVPSDPQVLVSPEAQAAIQKALTQFFGPSQGAAIYQQFLAAVKSGLLDALHAAFFAMLLTTVAAFVATLFLDEIPLRRSNASPSAQAAGARGRAGQAEHEPLPPVAAH